MITWLQETLARYHCESNPALNSTDMKAHVITQLFLFVSSIALTMASQSSCPPWFFPDGENGTECACSSVETNGVKCSQDAALLRISFCMTYSSATEDTEVGPCPYFSHYIRLSSGMFFLQLPNLTSNLTSFMCGSLHRKGRLCGECEDGFGPALYSYTLQRKKCWGHGLGWLLYISLTVIPTTVLYIVDVAFHVSAPSPPLSVLIFFCQCIVSTFRL